MYLAECLQMYVKMVPVPFGCVILLKTRNNATILESSFSFLRKCAFVNESCELTI
jgi:hypothetical protein